MEKKNCRLLPHKSEFASSQERESERDDHHFIIIMAQGGGGGGGGNGVKKKNDDVDLETNDEKRKSSSSLRESLRLLDESLRGKTTNFSTILVASLNDDETKRTFFKAPSSLTSAIGDAQDKQQITSENEEPKVKNKQDYLQDEMQPWVKPVGASLADPEQGPFIAWCEEHFREVTTEDAKKLIPSTSQPKLEEDPDFLTLPVKERSYHEEWEEMDRKMKEMEEENRRRARENARIESIQSKQKKKQKSKEHGTKQKGYVAGAKTVNDDAKFIVTRISPIADLKEIKEYCGVCFDGESYEEDPIIFCEGCDVAVHLACYGLQKVPEGDWMCRACSTRSSKAVKKQCCLCTCPDGALKPTRDNRWAHLFCAQWIPELFISNTKAMEPVENMNKLVKERLSMNCVVCKTRNQGACIQCAYGNCTVPVHPMCAVQTGMRMEVRTDKKKEEVVDYRVYCEKHAAILDKAAKVVEQRQQQDEGGTNPSGKDDDREEKSNKKGEDDDDNNDDDDDQEKESEKENNKKGGNKSASASPAKVMKPSSTPSKSEIVTPAAAHKNDKSANENSSYRDDMVSPMSPKHGPTDAVNEHMKKALEFPAPELPSDINEFLMDERQDAQIAVSKMKAAAANKAAGGGGGNSLAEKCMICIKMKKGTSCGTPNAPLKCLRRKENIESLQKEMENNLGMKSPRSESKILTPKEELERLNKHKHLFEKFAPEDEVTAELLRAQAALARVVNVTRTMANELLERIEADQPNVQKRFEKMERTVRDVEAYENRYRGGRWRVEKLRAGGQLPALADGGDGSLESLNASGALVDPLCTIVAMEDALCCVCTGGESEPPNEIMFCERCEVAVHQDCYGVGEIPDGDWLCWPCQIVEDREREMNAPRTRPPRYMREAGDGLMYDPRVKCELCPVMRGAMRAMVPAKLSSPLSEMKKCASIPNSSPRPGTTSSTPGGKMEVKMENVDVKDVAMTDAEQPEMETQQQYTPMNRTKEEMVSPASQKLSALKDDSKALVNQTPKTDSPANMRPHKLKWAHVVCAKWMLGISCDLFSNEPEAIRGEESVPSRLLQATCAVCISKEGAKVQCSKEGCRMYFHPLCARRANYYIEYGPQTEGTPVGHYCKNHSTQAKRDAGRKIKPSKIKGIATKGSSYVKSSVKRRPPTAEEITLLKRARVGLETLRLLCERVNKREKIRWDELESLGTLWKAQLNGQASGPVLKPGELEAAEDHGFIRQGPAVVYLTSTSMEEVAPSVPPGYELAREESIM